MPAPRRPVVLAVDDEPQFLGLLGSLLGGIADVLTATSGGEAVELAYLSTPDLVLMDAVMPGMDGFEALERLRTLPAAQDLPILFLSALASDEDIARALEQGALDFIRKPFHPGQLLAKVRNHLEAKATRDGLRALALRDGLTGLSNRREFDRTLEREWDGARRGAASLALVMVDVDRFKAYNDAFGHAEGDACLRKVAQALAQALPRRQDVLARYGGEEFAAILPRTGLEDAAQVAGRMRAAVEDLALPAAPGGGPAVTVSLGVAATLPLPSQLPEDLVIRADRALYRAKHGGRNRVETERTGDPVPAEIPRKVPRRPAFGRPSLLLVEDDPRMAALLEQRLAFLGAQVQRVTSAEEAARHLGEALPDLVLCDTMLPGLDGFGFCRAFKEDPRGAGLPFVILTSLSRELRQRALSAGADDYLSKTAPDPVFRMRVRANLELGLHRAAGLPPGPAPGLLLGRPGPGRDQVKDQMRAVGIPVLEAEPGPEALDRVVSGSPGFITALVEGPELGAWVEALRNLPAGRNLPLLGVAPRNRPEGLAALQGEFQDRIPLPLTALEARHRILAAARLGRARARFLAPG